MLVKEIGEFGLIDRIARLLPSLAPDVVTGIGDDVAVLRTSGPAYLLATCDIQVEGIHFIRNAITPYQLGKKAIAINISDIAAMGGQACWILVSLAIPGDTEVAFIEELYTGMREQAGLAGAAIVGGNVSRMESCMAIDVTVLGQIAPEHLVVRSTARVGDSILVTGFPGQSRAGLELIRRPEIKIDEEVRRTLLARHLTPQPRLRDGQLLARSGLVHAMIDVSDGLLADLGHICEASGTGAQVGADQLPRGEGVDETAGCAGADALSWITSGGEDYELLFTAAPESVPELREMLLRETGTSCSEIGKITGAGGAVRLVLADGKDAPVSSGSGWDHFAGKD
ncbi:MAG: thiamine-phosphate kinase [Desulfobacteraceae bacterium]|nr:thiamine-phosphate kinase [Desulfobacteraceae bacterium]